MSTNDQMIQSYVVHPKSIDITQFTPLDAVPTRKAEIMESPLTHFENLISYKLDHHRYRKSSREYHYEQMGLI